MSNTTQVENRLGKFRHARGISAAQLAKIAGVTRQTIYAMEAGDYIPNTAVALKLARALEVAVEDLFALAGDPPALTLPNISAVLLPGGKVPHAGQPVQLCRVDKRTMASAPSPIPWYLPASDAVVVKAHAGKANVQVLRAEDEISNRILVAGCDPAISVLARHAQAAGVEMVLAHRNSSQALTLLKEGCVHIAGSHLRDEASGESNIPEIGRRFPGKSVAAISFAIWEEGIVFARNNPKNIREVQDLARSDVTIVNREKGAGSRLLLDSRLKRAGITGRDVKGYDRIADGHLAAAWQIYSGNADACIATRAAARVFGLGFLPLVSERYDLVIRKQHLNLPAIQTLIDVLSRSGFRRELESLGGYETKVAGGRVL